MCEKRKQGGSDNNTDPDLSAQTHNQHLAHVEMHSIPKHRTQKLYKHENMSTIRSLAKPFSTKHVTIEVQGSTMTVTTMAQSSHYNISVPRKWHDVLREPCLLVGKTVFD